MSNEPRKTTRLFVYGTLMPGQPNFRRIRRFVRRVEPGTIRGVLVDLDAYPALIPGRDVVRGMVLEVENEALVVTDQLEGVHVEQSHALFCRRLRRVRLDGGGTASAWVYVFANPEHIARRPRLLGGKPATPKVYDWNLAHRAPHSR